MKLVKFLDGGITLRELESMPLSDTLELIEDANEVAEENQRAIDREITRRKSGF